jgi:hypothetical protein
LSLDYWRNEDKDCYLIFNKGKYYLVSEIYGKQDQGLGTYYARTTYKDLENLKNSIELLLSEDSN